MSIASPFGERRSDLRAAVHTANMMCRDMKDKPTDEEFSDLVRGLSRYLKCDQEPEPEDETADMDALALMLKQQEAGNGWTA